MRGEGPESGAEKRTRLSGGLVEVVVAVEGLAEGLVWALGARAGLMFFLAIGVGVGEERRRE